MSNEPKRQLRKEGCQQLKEHAKEIVWSFLCQLPLSFSFVHIGIREGKENIPCHRKMCLSYRREYTRPSPGATSRPSWRLWTRTLSGTNLKHLVYIMLASIGGGRQ